AKLILNLLLLGNNFYPVILYRRVQKESDELLRFDHSLWFVNQLPAQEANMLYFVSKSR
ncbi:unnamed protein product, partial [Heterotrigona itama]